MNMRMMRYLVVLCCLLILFPAQAWAIFGEFTIRDELELARKFDYLLKHVFPWCMIRKLPVMCGL